MWCVVVMCMRKGGSENRVCFEGGSCLSVRYCEQRMGADKLCVGNHGKARRHDLWPAAGGFCVCAGAHGQPANNWQSVGQRVGFDTSVVHACLVPSRDVLRTMRSSNSTGTVRLSQLRLVNLARIDHPHEIEVTKWRSLVK